MMVEFKWISLFLPAVLQFTAAAGKLPLSFTVRVGDEVTLPCENVIDGQQKCEFTTWLFLRSEIRLVELGENTKATENCSLVIKKVTIKDVGPYICQQYKSGQQQAPDSQVLLSVINMTEHQDADKVTLTCSVLTYEHCRHTVKFLYEGKDVDKDNKDMKTSQSFCYATVSFLDSRFSYKSKSNLKCEVTDGYSGKVQLFTFSPQSSEEKTDFAVKMFSESFYWVRFIIVSVGLAALIIIVVAVNIWTRTKGTKTQMDETHSSPPHIPPTQDASGGVEATGI